MDSREFLVIFLLVCSLIFLRDEVEGAAWNLSAEDHLELEKQLKVLNKPTIKTITTRYGEIYDCVDFYKQPAFDHPLLKNYTVNFQLKPSLPYNNSRDHSHVRLRNKQCPFGTVPIRRITKEDLIRERLAANINPLDAGIAPGAHVAVRQILFQDNINGAGAVGNVVYTPQASGDQYSAGRVKISNEGESLETGWRVDPKLYGDTLSHFYIRIDAGQTHCFDVRCPGFVVVDHSILIGGAIDSSKRGGTIVAMTAYLVRDPNNGNWQVVVEDPQTTLGFWPNSLFTSLSPGAKITEWGGEVFSPPGVPKPPMGAGFIPDGKDLARDAFFNDPIIISGDKFTKVDPDDLKADPVEDSKDYQTRVSVEDFSPDFAFSIFYGGSGGSTTTH